MKEYEIKVTKQDDGSVRFDWEKDAPIFGVDVDHDGNIAVCLTEGANAIHYKLTGDVEYVKKAFDISPR